MQDVNLKVNDPIVAAVMAEMADRDNKGFAKYGMTTFDNPLSLLQWLQHDLEETLDRAIYIKRAMDQIIRHHPEYQRPIEPINLEVDIEVSDPDFQKAIDETLENNDDKPGAIQDIRVPPSERQGASGG